MCKGLIATGVCDKVETRTLRAIRIEDLDLVLAAQAASTEGLPAASPAQVEFGLKSGLLKGIILEAPGRTMLLAWQLEGQSALFSMLYRVGSARHFFGDLHYLVGIAENILQSTGVKGVYAFLAESNPRAKILRKLYRRLGYDLDLIRVKKDL